MGNDLIDRLQVDTAQLYNDCISTTYRNLLKVGVHEVYMWPTARAAADQDKHSSDPNPIGPIANNPDPSAVQLTMEFEYFAHPVIFPNDVPAHAVKER